LGNPFARCVSGAAAEFARFWAQNCGRLSRLKTYRMKKYIRENDPQRCAYVVGGTVYLAHSGDHIYKTFGLATFNPDGWQEVFPIPDDDEFLDVLKRWKERQAEKAAAEAIAAAKQAEKERQRRELLNLIKNTMHLPANAALHRKNDLTPCKDTVSRPLTVKAVKEEIERQKSVQNSRSKPPIYFKYPTVRFTFNKKYISKGNQIAREMPDMGYSMGQVNRVIVAGAEIGRADLTETYAKSCKYRPTYGYQTIKISPMFFRKIEIIGGIVTWVGEKVSKHVYKCKTLQGKGSKQYFENYWADGYLTGDHHFSAGNDKNAINYANAYRKQMAVIAAREKAEKELQKAIDKFPLNRCFVSVEDSRAGGNCDIGTKNFAEQNGIDLSVTGAVRADWLYCRRNGSEKFVLRAINAAKKRYLDVK